MQVKSIAECSLGALFEHSAILSTCIKLPSVFKTFVLSIFEWPLKTGFTVFFSYFSKETECVVVTQNNHLCEMAFSLSTEIILFI